MPTTPAPTPEPPVACDDCVVWGDPHILTFDANHILRMQYPMHQSFLKMRHFHHLRHIWKTEEVEALQTGTFWLVRSENVHIQGRYGKFGYGREKTGLDGVAVGGPFLKGNTFVIEPLNGNVTWNNQVVLSKRGSDFSYPPLIQATYSKHTEVVKPWKDGEDLGIEVSLPKNVKLTVNRFSRHLSVKISMCGHEPQDGQCGNFNQDVLDDRQEILMARAGRPLGPDNMLAFGSHQHAI